MKAWNQCNVIYIATNKIWDHVILGVSNWLQFEHMSMKWKKVIIYVENDKHLDKFIRDRQPFKLR